MKYYLDTNIIIYALKGQFPDLPEHFRRIAPQSIVIPTVVMAEIEFGAQKSHDYQTTIRLYRQFTDAFIKIPFSEKASSVYGLIRNELQSSGNLIGPNDLMIAATVMSEDGILVTHNIKEFTRVNGLRMEDWTE